MKTFLMCVGSQKAGTTWLWHYLRRNPQIDFGFKKEYHVWDSLTIPEYRFFKDNLEERLKQRSTPEKLNQLAFMNNPDLYFRYFNRKLQFANITGDFTPQSSALSPQCMDNIQSTFQSNGVTTKAIFLLRDPVDRLQSMMRMKLKIRGVLDPSYDTELTLMDEHSTSVNYYMTGGYDELVPKFDKIFGDRVHYQFYDTLFTDQATRQITDFLGVAHHEADYDFNPKLSKTDNDLLQQDREHFEQLYKPIYDYTAQRFPQVTNLWTYYAK